MEDNKNIQINGEGLGTMPSLTFPDTIQGTFNVLKIDVLGLRRNYRFSERMAKLITENINLMPHEIHTDASEEKGPTGVIVGRTVRSEIIDGVLRVTADLSSQALNKRDISDFTLIPVGIASYASLSRRNGDDYQFSCFCLGLKGNSQFYFNKHLIIGYDDKEQKFITVADK
jgi:hypothetical protein